MSSDTVIDIQRKQNLETRVEKLLAKATKQEYFLLNMLAYLINHATFGGWLIDDMEEKLTEYEKAYK